MKEDDNHNSEIAPHYRPSVDVSLCSKAPSHLSIRRDRMLSRHQPRWIHRSLKWVSRPLFYVTLVPALQACAEVSEMGRPHIVLPHRSMASAIAISLDCWSPFESGPLQAGHQLYSHFYAILRRHKGKGGMTCLQDTVNTYNRACLR